MEWPKEFEGHDFEFYGNEGWFRLKIYDNQPTKKREPTQLVRVQKNVLPKHYENLNLTVMTRK